MAEQTGTLDKITKALDAAQFVGNGVEMLTPLTIVELERIARLLTEDDERQEREACEQRYWTENGSINWREMTVEAGESFEAWYRGILCAAPLPQLRALEAAYRATLP